MQEIYFLSPKNKVIQKIPAYIKYKDIRKKIYIK